MENLEELLNQWKTTPAEPVLLTRIGTDPVLQSRDLEVVPIKDRERKRKESAEHVDRMRSQLEAAAAIEHDPILLACTGPGPLWIVDGHHRFRAYQLAKRHLIPARVRHHTKMLAVDVSKLVNVTGAKLPLHKAQLWELVWQFLARLTMHGTRQLPAEYSRRGIGRMFPGISRPTIHSMMKQLPSVAASDPQDWSSSTQVAGKPWPRWCDVKRSKWADDIGESDTDARLRGLIDRAVEKSVAAADGLPQEAIPVYLRILQQELAADPEDEELDGSDPYSPLRSDDY